MAGSAVVSMALCAVNNLGRDNLNAQMTGPYAHRAEIGPGAMR